MKSIELKSRAKINLSIDVLGKREDGYHLVEMIMQTIDLYDIIKIKELDTNTITIKSNSSNIPLDENNFCEGILIIQSLIGIRLNLFNVFQGKQKFYV